MKKISIVFIVLLLCTGMLGCQSKEEEVDSLRFNECEQVCHKSLFLDDHTIIKLYGIGYGAFIEEKIYNAKDALPFIKEKVASCYQNGHLKRDFDRDVRVEMIDVTYEKETAFVAMYAHICDPSRLFAASKFTKQYTDMRVYNTYALTGALTFYETNHGVFVYYQKHDYIGEKPTAQPVGVPYLLPVEDFVKTAQFFGEYLEENKIAEGGITAIYDMEPYAVYLNKRASN